jgi:hypothetical protein
VNDASKTKNNYTQSPKIILLFIFAPSNSFITPNPIYSTTRRLFSFLMGKGRTDDSHLSKDSKDIESLW